MGKTAVTLKDITDAIRAAAQELDHPPTRREFLKHSSISEYHVNQHFNSWNEAVIAAGLKPNTTNTRIDDETLLADWGQMVRDLREIPTNARYQREGHYSDSLFQRRFGAWSKIPDEFREFAYGKPEWADVIALLPIPRPPRSACSADPGEGADSISPQVRITAARCSKLTDRPTYGNPIDFRGLRHEPVNEQGVVFLFGMVAKELGFLVEAVQGAYPDCEAKRQVDRNNWQRVRIEFEFESRNFRDHGHAIEGCDVIVCWRHNWPECPDCLEVVELSSVIKTLSKSED